jgi:glycosyltransferase involved in cell wall biosynthesis
VGSLLHELLTHPPAGYRVEPVYATKDQGYRYARRFTLQLLACPEDVLKDSPVEYRPGDIFFALDLHHGVALEQRCFYQDMRRYGTQVYFVVYDLLPVLFPQAFPKPTQREHQRWLEVVAENDGALCISRAVADELAAWVDTNGRMRERTFRIGLLHLSADVNASHPTEGLPDDAESVLKNLATRPTFLMVGTVEPRKAHAQTLAAFEDLWSQAVDANLVIVGKQGWRMDTLADRFRTHPEVNYRLFWLEGISDEYLEKIYAASTCLIAASEGEGFGLPLIEAAHHKLPIIARDIPVFKEVAGDHAFYFTGLEPESLASAIRQWLHLHRSGAAPQSDSMAYLTWAESTRALVDLLLDDKHSQWVHRWVPDPSIKPGETLPSDANKIRWKGWSEPELTHRWTDGKQATMHFVLKQEEQWQGKVTLRAGTLGTQRIGIRLNGVDLGEETLTLNDEDWVIDLNGAPFYLGEEYEMVLELPDARLAGNGDLRHLALRVERMTFK